MLVFYKDSENYKFHTYSQSDSENLHDIKLLVSAEECDNPAEIKDETVRKILLFLRELVYRSKSCRFQKNYIVQRKDWK
jgi:hypothetical protein